MSKPHRYGFVPAAAAERVSAPEAPSLVRQTLGQEDGATAIEYALIAAGIAVAIVGIVWALGDEISLMFANIQETIANRSPPG